MNIIIFLVILFVLVVSHEFGHFIVAKKTGMRVDEFSFGFPPKLFGVKKGETSYNFNLLPLGGYVKIYGENGDVNDIDRDRSFVNKPKYKQALVLVAGIVMNLLVAWVLLSIGFMSGMPSSKSATMDDINLKNESLVITSVLKNSPAEKVGLSPGDKILSISAKDDFLINSVNNIMPADVQSFISSHGDSVINISVEKNGIEKSLSITPEKVDDTGTPKIGISMDIVGKLKLPIHKAIWEGFKSTMFMTWGTIVGFYHLIHDAFLGKADINNLTGPVGIVGVVGNAYSFGFIYLLSFTALISINLAVLNLIPFPALDGGRLLFVLIEKIKGSRIKPEVAGWVNAIGFGLLMILMLFITYHDVIKLIK